MPRVGDSKSDTYTGDGYITVRHSETETVEAYLDLIANTVMITYNHDDVPPVGGEAVPRRWSHQRWCLDRRHSRPVWDEDPLPMPNVSET